MPPRRPEPIRRRRRHVDVLLALIALVPSAAARGQTAPADATAPATTEAARPTPRPATAPADDLRSSALINRQLDQNLDLDQRNRPVAEVLDFLRRQTGIKFDVSDEAYALLPYGRDTPITAAAKGTPLRRTLEAITAKLGLRFVLGDDAVQIRPLPALRRSGRRATVREISGLDLLANVGLNAIEDRQPAAKLLENIDLRLDQVDSDAKAEGRPEPGYRIENRLSDGLRDVPVFVPRNATLLGALDALAEQTGATWYPSGDGFIVLPKRAWVRRRLDEATVTKTYRAAGVPQVLTDLQRAAGLEFRIEPGAVARVPEESRAVNLSLDTASVREALDALGGVTGLGYVVNDGGVYVWNKDPSDPDAAPQGADRPILLVRLGDGTSLLLYPSDLNDEQRTQLEGRRRAAVEALAATLAGGDATPPPATAAAPAADVPATRPAG